MAEKPTHEELAAFVRGLGVRLPDEELPVYVGLLETFVAMLGALDRDAGAAPTAPPGRTWTVPAPAENPHNAWTLRCEIRAREDGPLAGLRFAAKDNMSVAGLPMQVGSAILEGHRAESDAVVVTRLLEAGAVLTGKASCEDLCLSGGSHTSVSGPVHNPRRRGHTAGGSSSGSAALVAAGEVELAIGTDQGGSVRVPSALCGVVGMKPTWGLVPYTGIPSIDPSLDHVGPITAGVRDNARALAVMAGPDGADPRQLGALTADYGAALERGAEGLRIALVSEGFSTPGMQREVAAAVRAAAERLAGLGARVDEVGVPEHREGTLPHLALLCEGAWRTLFQGEGQDSQRSDPGAPELARRMARWREHAAQIAPLALLLALAGAWEARKAGGRPFAVAGRQARRIRAGYDRALADADALLLPTCPVVAPPLPGPDAGVEESVARCAETTANTQPLDLSHHPALSVPCAQVGGLPVGMMLVGRHYDEATLYRVAYAFEQSVDWRSL